MSLIREAYERREITNITWIKGDSNVADGLTKTDRWSKALGKLAETIYFSPDTECQIHREREELKSTVDLNELY